MYVKTLKKGKNAHYIFYEKSAKKFVQIYA